MQNSENRFNVVDAYIPQFSLYVIGEYGGTHYTDFDLLTWCVYQTGTWRLYNVAPTSMQRHDIASTLRRRCLNVACPMGKKKKAGN